MASVSRQVWTVIFVTTMVVMMLSRLPANELSIQQILDDLSSGPPKAKVEAARFLATNTRYAKQAIPLLVAALEDERPEEEIPFGIPAPPWLVADEARRALVAFDVLAVPVVTQLLDHTEANVRRRAAWILENIGAAAEASAPRLSRAIANEKETKVRFDCLRAYGAVEPDTLSLARVLLVALDAETPDYRALAIRICGRRGLQNEEIIWRLRMALDDPRSRWGSWTPDTRIPIPIRLDAAEALGRIGPAAKVAEPKLRRMMASDVDIETRVSAALAVCRIMIEDQQAVDVLIQVASQPARNPAAAPVAVRSLGELGPIAKRALPVLTRSCDYEDDEDLGFDTLLRSEALTAVAAVGGVGSLVVLKDALRSPHPSDREAAAIAISQLGREARDAVPDLVQAAQDERGALSTGSRGAAIKALGDIGRDAEAAIPVLARIANASYEAWDKWLADTAKDSLRKIGGGQ